MRLYKITALNTSHGDTPDSDVTWVGSLAEASTQRKKLTIDGFARKEIETEEVDVPTDKAGLIGFLNKMRNEA